MFFNMKNWNPLLFFSSGGPVIETLFQIFFNAWTIVITNDKIKREVFRGIQNILNSLFFLFNYFKWFENHKFYYSYFNHGRGKNANLRNQWVFALSCPISRNASALTPFSSSFGAAKIGFRSSKIHIWSSKYLIL